MANYAIVLYNGKNRQEYDTSIFSGDNTKCSPPGNFPVLEYDNILQNGSGGGDGLALVDAGGEVIEFISYEGSFTAIDGPANGKTSVNIDVYERSGTSIGLSLQLVGDGCSRSDFTWRQDSAPSSVGAVNDGQEIVCEPSRDNEFSLNYNEL